MSAETLCALEIFDHGQLKWSTKNFVAPVAEQNICWWTHPTRAARGYRATAVPLRDLREWGARIRSGEEKASLGQRRRQRSLSWRWICYWTGRFIIHSWRPDRRRCVLGDLPVKVSAPSNCVVQFRVNRTSERACSWLKTLEEIEFAIYLEKTRNIVRCKVL